MHLKYIFWSVHMNNLWSGKEEKYTKQERREAQRKQIKNKIVRDEQKRDRDISEADTRCNGIWGTGHIRAASAIPDIHLSS